MTIIESNPEQLIHFAVNNATATLCTVPVDADTFMTISEDEVNCLNCWTQLDERYMPETPAEIDTRRQAHERNMAFANAFAHAIDGIAPTEFTADSHSDVPETQNTDELVIDNMPEDPTALRMFRESLGLSRRMVEVGTGLSGSVVWRAEQPNRKITPEQFMAIYTFLRSYKENAVEIDKPATPKRQKSTDSNLQDQLDKAENKITQYTCLVEDIRAALTAEIDAATKAKRSTKALREIVLRLEQENDMINAS